MRPGSAATDCRAKCFACFPACGVTLLGSNVSVCFLACRIFMWNARSSVCVSVLHTCRHVFVCSAPICCLLAARLQKQEESIKAAAAKTDEETAELTAQQDALKPQVSGSAESVASRVFKCMHSAWAGLPSPVAQTCKHHFDILCKPHLSHALHCRGGCSRHWQAPFSTV